MKYSFLSLIIIGISLLSLSAFSQTEDDTPLLGLPGDNLDLYAVLELFQKSPTIEDFEKSLNDAEAGINNLDLNLDEKVDFIKVVTKQDGESFSFVLQVDVSEKEVQDVAVILLDKDKQGNVTLQIVGDKDLYGKDYVIEPVTEAIPAVTSNPAYAGDAPVASAPATTTVVVVETVPVVQYVYSPVYVPYYPPYYYSYYPPYYRTTAVIAIGIYRHNHYHHHNRYHGGHYHGGRHRGGGNTVVINNSKNFNNYNNSRKTSNTVNNNKKNGNYNSRNNTSSRPSTGASTSNRASTGKSASTRPSTGASSSTRPSTGSSKSTRPSTGTSPSTTNRSSSSQSRSNYSSSPSRSMQSSPSRSSGSSPSRSSGSSRSRSGGGRSR